MDNDGRLTPPPPSTASPSAAGSPDRSSTCGDEIETGGAGIEALDLATASRMVQPRPFPLDAIDQVLRYYYGDTASNRPIFNRSDLIKVILEILASTAGIYYWPSADTYAKALSTGLRENFVLGNTTTGVLFLMNATHTFLDGVEREIKGAPPELRDILKSSTCRELAIRYMKMLSGSLLCAIPFGITAYLFPLPGCISVGCLAGSFIHATIANTILHAISWRLILDIWYYRLPILPFEKLYSCYQLSKLPQSEKQVVLREQGREKVYSRYRTKVGDFCRSAVEEIIIEHLNNGRQCKFETKDFQSLVGLASQIMRIRQGVASSNTYVSTLDKAIFKSTFLLGAVFMIAGCIGWVVNPSYVLYDKIGVGGAVLGGLSGWSMAALCIFYGQAFIPRGYRFLTNFLSEPLNSIPIEGRLHPISYTLFTLIASYLSIFSFATAEALVDTIFKSGMWDWARGFLKGCGYGAIPLLSFLSLIDLYCLWTRKITAQWGNEENKKIARLLLQPVGEELATMEGGCLITQLKEIAKEMQQIVVGSKFARDTAQLDSIEYKIEDPATQESSYRQSICGRLLRWWRGSHDEQRSLLHNQESGRVEVVSAF